MTAATYSTSFLLTLLPQDAGTSIANELADLGSKMVIPLTAIMVEKYVFTLAGGFAFQWLLPIALGIYIAFLWIGTLKIHAILSYL